MTPTEEAAGAIVRPWGLRYRVHNGISRSAVLLLPAGYGPETLLPHCGS
jgi:hypothetical protein